MKTQDFAKIVRGSNGEQVLFFVEPDGNDYILHQMFYLQEELLIDVKVTFKTEEPEPLFEHVQKVTVNHADALIKKMREELRSLVTDGDE